MISKTFLNPKKNPTNYIMFIVKVLITKYLDKYLYKNCYFVFVFVWQYLHKNNLRSQNSERLCESLLKLCRSLLIQCQLLQLIWRGRFWKRLIRIYILIYLLLFKQIFKTHKERLLKKHTHKHKHKSHEKQKQNKTKTYEIAKIFSY